MQTENKVYKLGGNSLMHLERIFTGFKKSIEEASDDFAFFRGELYMEEGEECIFLDLLVSNIDGNYKRFTLQFNPANGLLYLPEKFALQRNEEEVKASIMKCVNALDNIEFPISKLYFDISPSFFTGRLIPDSQAEGMYIMYLIGERDKTGDASGFNFADATATCGSDISGDKKKIK